MKKFFYVLVSFFIIYHSHAVIINIPADQPTIQAGINLAMDGDTILVHPGTYFENINYNGKNLTVASLFLKTQDTAYIYQTVINGGGGALSPVVVFENEEDSTAILSGFTLTNGCNFRGGGIYCMGASPKLSDLNITNNFTHYWNGYSRGGGGIYCENSNLTLENSFLHDNSAMTASCPAVGLDCGGGILCRHSDILMMNTVILNNTAESGGGLYCDNSSPVLQNVIISNNTATPDYNPLWMVFYDSFGGGMSCVNGSNPVLSHVTILNNTAFSGWSNPTYNSYSDAFGGGIYCSNSNPNLQHVTVTKNSIFSMFGLPDQGDFGGGIFCTGSFPALLDVIIANNSAYNGGGIYCQDQSAPYLVDVSLFSNSAVGDGGGVYCASSTPEFDSINRCNLYLNAAFRGNDLFSDTLLHVIVDTFTVLFPSEYHAEPLENFTFDILHGQLDQVDADLYVSPNGDNTSSGLTADDPLKNIRFACSIIQADSTHQNTIHLLPGIYSNSSNEEIFPLNIPAYINLSGVAKDSVLLDAETQSDVLIVNENTANQISELTISGASENGITIFNSDPEMLNVVITNCYNGIYCDNSNPILDSLVIMNNSAYGIQCNNGSSPFLANILISGNNGSGLKCENNSNPVLSNVLIDGNSGGAIACYNSSPVLEGVILSGNSSEKGSGFYGEHSDPEMIDVVIANNTASSEGGGIYCDGCGMMLSGTRISGNSAYEGGGIYCSASTLLFDQINRCNIYSNNAYWGNELWSDSILEVVVDTFTVLYPTGFHAYPIENYSFDILHGKVEQVNADLYVSPFGDNGNSGLSADEPLKTIHCAFSVILADSLNSHIIHLSDGTYSPSSNGESYPVNMFDYLSLKGESEEDAILNAEGNGAVLIIDHASGINISDLTVTGGSDNGISVSACDPVLQNITISNNNGIGIYCDQSNPVIENVFISGNTGGLMCINNSNPDMLNTTIYGNGYGIACENASNPYLYNAEISGNNGRGVLCSSNSNPFLENVLITGNKGGIYCSQSSPTLINVTISENTVNGFWSSGGYGGGIYCEDHSSPLLENVIISDNSVTKSWQGTGGFGGGVYCKDSCDLVLKNVLFSGNSAEYTGGGMACWIYCNPLLINVTMTNNTAGSTGGAFYSYISSNPVIVNAIFWDDLPNEVFATYITINYSDIQGGWEGEGNIEEDPLFMGFGDYPYALSDESPCINTGTPDTTGLNLPELDLAGNPRFYGGRIDMGAYENQNMSTFVNQFVSDEDFEFHCQPNPFSDELTITYVLPELAHTKIEIYNSAGGVVKVVSNNLQPEGKHVCHLKTDDLPAGVYFCKVKTNERKQTKKIIKL
ncbi:MAG: right-handed parallel beta-helix repeat-containing protein [Bacteroidetes bacterium]|nr:right-handed parallel beta-helix repeat-containing protein [Bacteroidota bacterium]